MNCEGTFEDGSLQKSRILTTLQDELANTDELEGVGEILESINKFMDTYKRRVTGNNLIDFTNILNNSVNLRENLSDERYFSEFLDKKLLDHLTFEKPS